MDAHHVQVVMDAVEVVLHVVDVLHAKDVHHVQTVQVLAQDTVVVAQVVVLATAQEHVQEVVQAHAIVFVQVAHHVAVHVVMLVKAVQVVMDVQTHV